MLSDKEFPGSALRAEVGSRMRRARETLRITPDEAARHFRISIAGLCDWETGRSSPGADALREMATFYRIPADGLLALHSEEQFLEDLCVAAYLRLNPVQRRAIQQITEILRRTQKS